MKNNKKIAVIVIVNILIIGIICSFINIKVNVVKEKQIIKEMSESAQLSNLQTQINTLNKEHTDYANYIQASKRKIASAITEMGVETLENDTADTMANNIRSLSGTSSFEFIDVIKNQTLSQGGTITLDKGIYMIYAFSVTDLSGTWSYNVTSNKDIEFKINIHNNGLASSFSHTRYTGMAMIYLNVKSDNTTITISAKHTNTLSYAYAVYGIYKIG